jgi:hypothetical protein
MNIIDTNTSRGENKLLQKHLDSDNQNVQVGQLCKIRLYVTAAAADHNN